MNRDGVADASSPLEYESGGGALWGDRGPRGADPEELLWCPCPDDGDGDGYGYGDGFHAGPYRILQDAAEMETASEPVKTWEVVYMCLVLLVMFVALLSDRVGADHVMIVALTLCMAANIVTVEEGIAGFANEGVLTILVLFVVAAGISLTGALDWYMGKLLGRPKNAAGAQLKLMGPIAVISAFLNNTPVVAVMIPIVQRWGTNIGVSPQQLLIPLSFASILGGTCTLIGTSTNLVVVGLLKEQYPSSPTIGIFDLGQYGVPVAFAGIAYILIAAPFLLPGSARSRNKSDGNAVELPAAGGGGDFGEEILLGARLTQWSPAAGRSVQRSGLRDTGGIYLVSVHRSATGNVHRAVGPDFVLNVGDVLYFTGLVETFGEFCEEHGLEVVTNELEEGGPTLGTIPEMLEEGGDGTGADEEKKEEEEEKKRFDNDATEQRKSNSGRAVKFADKQNSIIGSVKQSLTSSTLVSSWMTSAFDDDAAAAAAAARGGGSSSATKMTRIGSGGGGGRPSAVMIRRGSGSETDLKIIADHVAVDPHDEETPGSDDALPPPPPLASIDMELSPIMEEIGTTKESLTNADADHRMRSINRMTDMIRGIATPGSDPAKGPNRNMLRRMDTPSSTFEPTSPAKIVVVTDTRDSHSRPLVVVGINSPDRPGLLLDISKGLLRLGIQLHHSEARVVRGRSLSIWRCEVLERGVTDIEEIWSMLNALLEDTRGIEAVKRRGLRVVRAVVTRGSRLVGATASEVGFRDEYRAAIVAVQRGGRNTTLALSQVRFKAGDVLVLQASDDSPLLIRPPDGFYRRMARKESGRRRGESESKLKKKSSVPSVKSLVSLVSNVLSQKDVAGMAVGQQSGGAGGEAESDSPRKGDRSSAPCSEVTTPGTSVHNGDADRGETDSASGFFIPDNSDSDDEEMDAPGVATPASGMSLQPDDEEAQDHHPENTCMVWKDLQVIFPDESGEGEGKGDGGGAPSREFLTAMQVAKNSGLANKTAPQLGLDKLPGITLVSIERPVSGSGDGKADNGGGFSHGGSSVGSLEDSSSLATNGNVPLIPVLPDQPLAEGDIIWFAGSATAVGNLRKIPGLKSYESDEVQKINEKIHDRRLVQAVIARKGPLVGKTVKEVRFRTRYGAAVIAVHREGKRLHEHPGKVKLQGGDVLLLEAGPTFLARNADNAKSFALLSEVEDSAPPRLRLLIPALLLAFAMLAVFTAGVASLLVCALVAAILMVLIGILSQQEARDAVNWEIYVTIASAFGIGTALTNSGVAGGVANALVWVGTAVGIGDAGLFGAVYFATFLISNVVTNNAAAALIFPIAMDAAEQFGTSQLLMSYCIMLGASASFMSPFGYTTNLLIYGPGGYKYKDFLIIGIPMQLVLWVLSVAVLSQGNAVPWYLSWIVTFAVLVLVSIIRVCDVTICDLFTAKFKCATGRCKRQAPRGS